MIARASTLRVLEIVTISIWILASNCSAKDRAPLPRRIDSAEAARLVPDSARRGSLPRTSDWTILEIPGDSLILLADGTDWTRLARPPARRDSLSGADPGYASVWTRFKEGCFPRQGITLALDADQGRGIKGSTYSQGNLDLLIRPGITRWASLELGIGWEKAYSSPVVHLEENESSPASGIRGLVGICGPVVCLEMVRHSLPQGPQTWLQPGMDSLARNRTEGEFWTAMATRDFSGAWERRLSVRAGSVRYQLAVCPGLWSGFYQELGLGDLPAGPLRFGTYLNWTSSRAAVRGEVGFAPIQPWKSADIRFSPFTFSMSFRKMGEMQISAHSRVDFPDPFLALVRRWQS